MRALLARVLGVITAVALGATPAAGQQGMTVRGDPAVWEEVSRAWGQIARLRSYRMRMLPPPGQPEAERFSMVMEFVAPDRRRMVVDMPDTMTVEVITVGQEMRRRVTLKGQLAEQAARNPAAGGQIVNQIMGGGVFGFISNVVSAVTNPIGFATSLAISYIAQRVAQQAARAAGADDLRPGVWSCRRFGEASSAGEPQGSTEVTAVRAGDGTLDGARTRLYDVTFVTPSSSGPVTSRMRVHVLADRQLVRRVDMLDAGGQAAGAMEYYDFDAPITIDLPACP